ncbi:MAG: cell wall hydrolase [Spirulinaceae cyanobacterium SM2_1_0]|nr:cell wall hydrolase [Spirulinaceae cyanobacterium SM2_1_0]
MKFGIDIGHNAPPDSGAVGLAKEDELTRAVGKRVIAQLTALGHSVIDCTPSWATSVLDSLRKRVNAANASRVDIFVSIHFNAFNGRANGTEIFATSSAASRLARPVLERIVALGYYSRGVKNGSHLYVLTNTYMPAILIECCFLDSARDMDLFNTELMAKAIVAGLAGEVPDGDGGERPRPGPDDKMLELQQALNRLQIGDRDGNPLTVDGLFGTKTSAALEHFHAIVGISAPGQPTAATWKALADIFERPTLRPQHATGQAVRYVQSRLGAGVDGVFGAMTAAAVERFQVKQHIAVDGIVGGQTWNRLLL